MKTQCFASKHTMQTQQDPTCYTAKTFTGSLEPSNEHLQTHNAPFLEARNPFYLQQTNVIDDPFVL